MFYSNFYTPFPYAFYPYSVTPFDRPTGFVLKQGEIDSWWGNYPLGNPPKVPKYLGGQSPISGPAIPFSFRSYVYKY
ncbi:MULTISPECIES: hypothetical protein [Priestia]|uniref:hypothetical protein n=1 Tax=Priestia TaxID=2800373 RepID=UPI001293DA8D|nr:MULTISPECIES: hypothetical protein [Priestia]MED4003490.1 hypothetical protein [Priestia aryabhattai]MQR85261.1 hypothetical protein [Priestia megaterium]